MNFPRFWANGSHDGFNCWRWSNQSLAEAQTLATEAARRIAARFADPDFIRGDRYAYGDRPLREPVLRELKNAKGDVIGAVTRNAYGCHVLNTARVMFVDVDLPEPKSSAGGFLGTLFGKKPAALDDPAAATLAKAQAWVQQHPDWGWRIYRTRAGLRLLATHALFDPEGGEAVTAFDALGSDPLYRRLCKVQKCFRARLTPKPWRCDVSNPPARWPWLDKIAETRFNMWEEDYRGASSDYATCELLSSSSNVPPHPDVQLVVVLHDEATRAESKLPLA